MAVYEVTGPTRDTLRTEGSAEVLPVDADAMAIVSANIESIRKVASNIAALPDIQASVTQAQVASANAAAAASAAQSAANSIGAVQTAVDAAAVSAQSAAAQAVAAVDTSDANADRAGDQANNASGYAVQANDLAALVRAYVNNPPGTDAEPGKPGIQTYLVQAQDFLSRAPNLQGKAYVTAGVVGTETVVMDAAFLGKMVRVNRATGHDMKFKVPGGLYTGPPEPGSDESWAWVHFLREGDGDVYFEGSGGAIITTTVFPPDVLLSQSYTDRQTQGTPARAATEYTLQPPPIANGLGRKLVVLVASIHHTTPATDLSGRADAPWASFTRTQKNAAGTGGYADATPLKGAIFTADLPDSYVQGAGVAPKFYVTVPPDMAGVSVAYFILQDVSGTENDAIIPRAGAATTESAFTTPTVARSTVLAADFRVGVDASPVTFGPGDLQEQWVTTFTTTNKDIAAARNRRKDVTAVAQTFNGASPKAGPALMMVMSLKPRTVTTPGGTTNLVSDPALGNPPKIPTKGQQATLYLSSDGLMAYLDV